MARADQRGRLVAIHLRHLDIHQHRVVTAGLDHAHRLHAGGGQVHLKAATEQHLAGDLLVDLVVVHHQHAGAGQALRRRRQRARRQRRRRRFVGGQAQRLRNGQQHARAADRLDQAVADAELAGRAHGRLAPVFGSHDHDRRCARSGCLAQAPHRVGAMGARHVPVQHHHVHRFRRQVGIHGRRRRIGRPGSGHQQAGVAQLLGEHGAHHHAVVHHQYPRAGQRRQQPRRVVVARRQARQGNAEMEAAALSRRAVDADHAAHGAHQLLRNRQAQPGAAVQARGAAVGLAEGVEQALLLLGADAHAAVADGEPQAVPVRPRLPRYLHHDLAARGELEGIAHQVDQHLAQAQRIAGQAHRHVRVGPGHQLQAFFRRAPRKQVHHLVEHIRQVERHAFQRQLARLDLGKVQDVVDDAQQILAGAVDLVEVIARLRGQVEVRAEAGKAEDGVHRRADLVADIGQEVALGAGGGFGIGARLLDGADRIGFLEGRDERLLERLEHVQVGPGERLLLLEHQIALHCLAAADAHCQHRAGAAQVHLGHDQLGAIDQQRTGFVQRHGRARRHHAGLPAGMHLQLPGIGLADQRAGAADVTDRTRLEQDRLQQRIEIELVVDRLDNRVDPRQVARAGVHLLLQLQLGMLELADAPAVQAPAQQQYAQRRARARPPGLVPGRQEAQRHGQLVRTPGAVAVAAAHMQAVGAGRHVGVGGDAVAGVGLHPVLVVALQAERVAVAGAGGIVKRGNFDVDVAGAGRDFQAGAVRRQQRRGRHLACIELHIADHQLRLVVPALHRRLPYHHVATRGTEHRLAVGGPGAGPAEVGLEHQAVGPAEQLDTQGLGVDHGNAIAGRCPHAAAGVEPQAAGVLARQAGTDGQPQEARLAVGGLAVENGDAAAVGAHPQAAAAIEGQGVDQARRQAVAADRLGQDLLGAAGGRIETVQAITGAHPQHAVRRFQQGGDAAVGKAAGSRRPLAVGLDRGGARIVAQQTSRRAQP